MKLLARYTTEQKGIFYVCCIVVCVLFFRRYDLFLTPQLYAEDGVVFLQEYTQHGIKTLFMPYAGYLHLLPRLIAFTFGTLKVNYLYIPACYSYSCLIITMLVAVAIYRTSYHLGIRNRVLYATVFLLIPVGDEIFMNVTNTIWISVFFLINFIFVGYKSYPGSNKAITLAALFIAALTGPFSLIVAPVVVIMLFLMRRKLSLGTMVPFFVILLGGALQFVSLKFFSHGSNRGWPAIPEKYHLLRLFTNNVANLFFLRTPMFADMPAERKFFLSIILLGVIAYFFFKRYTKILFPEKHALLAIGFLALSSFIVVYWPTESYILALGIPRYYAIPYTCLAWLMILGFDHLINGKTITGYLIFFILHSNAMRYPLPYKRWKEQIKEYYEGKREVIEIFPDGWTFRLPKLK